MEVVEFGFSRLAPEEFELITYSLLNTALTCTDASIRTKIYNLRCRIIYSSVSKNID